MENARLICLVLFGFCYLSKAFASEDNVVTITSILTRPYLYQTEANSTVYEGFVPDLVSLLATELGFDYRIVLVKDGRYGNKRVDGTWNGMIGELTRMEADMAVAPLTISSMRRRVVDFSQPFQFTGLRMLMKKSTASYVKNWEDLASNDNVTAIVLNSGSTQNAFRTTRITPFEQIWAKMATSSESFVGTIDEGVEKVRDTPASVFITESQRLNYLARCYDDLIVTGEPWSMRTYGVATPLGSPYTDRIDLAILELREIGELEKLERKWWLDLDECNINDQ